MRISDWSSDVCSSDLRMTGVATTEKTRAATLIQTRHRVPETPLHEDQILVYQVPIPEPLRWLEPRETETRKMHGDRKSVVEGKSVSVRVDLGGRRSIKKKNE